MNEAHLSKGKSRWGNSSVHLGNLHGAPSDDHFALHLAAIEYELWAPITIETREYILSRKHWSHRCPILELTSHREPPQDWAWKPPPQAARPEVQIALLIPKTSQNGPQFQQIGLTYELPTKIASMPSEASPIAVNEAFFRSIHGLAATYKMTRLCPEPRDDLWVRAGILRILEEFPSGRGFLQQHGPRLGTHPKVPNYFSSLHSARRPMSSTMSPRVSCGR